MTLKSCILFSSLCVLLIGIGSCKHDDSYTPADYAYEYYPLDTGHYVIYDVDSIKYSYVIGGNPMRDSARYQIKELIADTFYDGLNEVNYRIEQYKRKDENSPWVIDVVQSVKRTKTALRKKETDLEFIKLVFPIQSNESWDGNIYIPKTEPYDIFRDWHFFYETINSPYAIGSFYFDSTITVSEINDTSNIIAKKLSRAVYAKNVGLIYREWEILNKQDAFLNWETGNLNGFRIRMRLNSYN